MAGKPEWVAAAEATASKWFIGFEPELKKVTGLLRPIWTEYGKAIEAGSGVSPKRTHALRLIELVFDSHREAGSAAHLKKRRERDGLAIANAAKKIKRTITAKDMLPWDAGYLSDDPMQKSICHSLINRMDKLRDHLPSTGNFEKWQEVEQDRFQDGQVSAICSLPDLMDELCKAAEKWAKTPVGGHVRGQKAARQRLLAAVMLKMLSSTGSRQRKLSARIVNALFPELPELDPSRPEAALNKSQKKSLTEMERFWLRKKPLLLPPIQS